MKVLLVVTLMLSSSGVAMVKGWRGIVPLHSDRADVERLLGAPTGECRCFYETGSETVRVEYSRAPCVGYPSGWNVPTDTVLTLDIRPNIPQKFADLHLVESEFYKAADDTLTTYYSNRLEGVQYTVSSQSLVEAVSYIPSSSDSSLRCNCFPRLDESVARSIHFDEFQLRAIGDTLARLDNYVIALLNDRRWVGYIVLYAGNQTSSKQMSAYRRSIMRHVLEKRAVPKKRIKLIEGGYRRDPEVELYLLSDDLSPPEPRGTWVPCPESPGRNHIGLAASNTRLERTRHERAPLLSCVGEPLKRSVSLLPKLMREEILKQFFNGNADAKVLARDLVGSLVTKGDITKHPIEDMTEPFQVLPEHLIRLCNSVLAGEINPKYLQAVGFCITASDNFEYDTDTSEGNLVGETVMDWSAPMVHYPLTRQNVEKFRHRLVTGEDLFTISDAS